MDRIEEIDGIHAVVIENYRRRIPLLERKTGSPIKPEGADLWILFENHDRARSLLRCTRSEVNEMATIDRRHTFERHLHQIPSNAAVLFSKDSASNDDALLQKVHPSPGRRRQTFVWNAGTYHLSVTTAECGQYIERRTRIGGSALSPDAFAEAVVKASERLHLRSPFPFDDADGQMVVSQATANILSMLSAPAAADVRHWLSLECRTTKNDTFDIAPSSLTEPDGIAGVTLAYGPRRIRSRIRYVNGDELTDLGLQHKGALPATIAQGLKGSAIDQVVQGGAIGSWTIDAVCQFEDRTHFGLSIPAVALEPPRGANPIDEHLARSRLADVLSRRFDLENNDLGDKRMIDNPDGPYMLRGNMDVQGMLNMLPPEVGAYVVGRAMHRPVDLTPWLGQGELRRHQDKMGIVDSPTSILADAIRFTKDEP